MCEPYKSLKTILGLAKPTSNHFLQFSLNFFNLLQFASCSFFFLQIFSFFLTVFLLSSFFFESCFTFEGIFSTYQPCRSNARKKAKIPEPPELRNFVFSAQDLITGSSNRGCGIRMIVIETFHDGNPSQPFSSVKKIDHYRPFGLRMTGQLEVMSRRLF